jgi:hypothetical protein
MSGEMSRGEMIRRLDEVSKQVHDQLENGPLTAEERQALATSLGRLLPVVADSLQDEEDQHAAEALQHEGQPASNRLPEPIVTYHTVAGSPGARHRGW